MTSPLQGSMMFIIDIDTENGGMQMNNDFCVDFGDEPDGPALAHEVTLSVLGIMIDLFTISKAIQTQM